MIAAALINENRFSFSLNACAKDYLGEIKNETFLNEKAKELGIYPKADLWRLPAGYVGYYAEQDAALTFKLWQYFKNEIVKEIDIELAKLYSLFDNGVKELNQKVKESSIDLIQLDLLSVV